MKIVIKSNLMGALFVLLTGVLFSASALAANAFNDFGELAIGGGEVVNTYQHTGAPTTFTDIAAFSLGADGTVNGRIFDLTTQAFPELFNISSMEIKNVNSGFSSVFSTAELTSGIFTLGNLVTGSYLLTLTGTADGDFGGVYSVGLSAVPLPAAAWLFGSAILGFVGYSVRRRV